MSGTRGVAIVGAGDMGAKHALHWAATGAEIRAVYDPEAQRAQALAARTGARVADSAETALQTPGVEVASICTPTSLHAPLTIAALEAGRDVLCEKPVALTLADAEAMAAAERRAGRRLRIGFMRRFDPLWRRVEAFRDELADPLLAQATLAAGVRPKTLMHDARVNGGPVIDMACHLFDRWERLFGGPPLEVAAHGHTFGADRAELATVAHKALDTVQVTLRYPRGGVGQFQLSWGLPRGVPHHERHTYLAPGGMIEVDGATATWITGDGPLRWGPGHEDPWGLQIQAFARELDGAGPQGLADVEDGIRALRASLAVLAAAASGRPVAPDAPDLDAATAPAAAGGTP
ncbi:MAG: Gfo/Idh/MocA family oxidoreductase [Trueperaceae bacterium]|nr:Gfo/Idh/MocA family oxidoreductase [Trueperaceae bacterium]